MGAFTSTCLVEWLKSPGQDSLRRAFTVWLKRVLLPGRMPGVDFNNLNELQEVKSMLAERVIEWTEQWEQRGMQKGFKKGIERGIDRGIQQGRQEGEASLLLRLMERRFGSVDDATRHRLQTDMSQSGGSVFILAKDYELLRFFAYGLLVGVYKNQAHYRHRNSAALPNVGYASRKNSRSRDPVIVLIILNSQSKIPPDRIRRR